jgi:hypothetical protein
MITRRFVAFASHASVSAEPARLQAGDSLLGSWNVDLRPSPDAAPYIKKLVITAVRDGRIVGHFYDGSSLQAGRINARAAREQHFAFFTDPGEGVYQSSGRQMGIDRLEGMTRVNHARLPDALGGRA